MMAFAEKQIAAKNIRTAPVNLFKGKKLSAVSVRLSAGMDNYFFAPTFTTNPLTEA